MFVCFDVLNRLYKLACHKPVVLALQRGFTGTMYDTWDNGFLGGGVGVGVGGEGWRENDAISVPSAVR